LNQGILQKLTVQFPICEIRGDKDVVNTEYESSELDWRSCSRWKFLRRLSRILLICGEPSHSEGVVKNVSEHFLKEHP